MTTGEIALENRDGNYLLPSEADISAAGEAVDSNPRLALPTVHVNNG